MSSPAGALTPGAAGPPAAAGVPAALAAAQPAPAPAAPRCDNCGAAVPGRYCGNCGQRFEPPVHSLRHFLTVAMEDVTHADSRLWRTLAALLFRPGYLTREFLAGRRVRYLPPVRLYLVLSVAFFLCASLGGASKAARVAPLEEPGAQSSAAAPPGESAEQRAARECAMINYDGPWAATLRPAMQQACLRIRADKGRSLNEALRHNLPRVMFLFLPLLAGLMMLLYWRPRHYYVEHLLLLVHNHAFVFLAVPIAWGLGALLPAAAGVVDLALFVYVAWYVYRSMRIMYGQGRWLTLAKFASLAFFYMVFGLLMFMLNFVYSALTLES